MREQEIICIACPLGCRGKVMTRKMGKATFEGYRCKEGKKYASTEATEPRRILTATVIADSQVRPLLPVRTDKAIPKNKLRQCMTMLAKVRVKPPVSVGDVIAPNVLDTGANIVSTGTLFVATPRRRQGGPIKADQ